MIFAIVRAVLSIVCAVISLYCAISITIENHKTSKMLDKEIKKRLPYYKLKLKFRQWLAVRCKRKVVVVYGGRRTGKSLTAEYFAAKTLCNNGDVFFITSDMNRAQFAFNNMQKMLDSVKVFRKKLEEVTYGQPCKSIVCRTKSAYCEKHRAYMGDRNFFDDPFNYKGIEMRGRRFTLVADDIDDIPQFLLKISCVENYSSLRFGKIFIVKTPREPGEKEAIKSIDGNAKIYTWRVRRKKMEKQIVNLDDRSSYDCK